tara:strand:- start:6709 stop:7143 length:435 start_codon:yes stop_codon:yes gene_type:complete
MRLSDLTGIKPITRGELEALVDDADHRTLRIAVALRDAWDANLAAESRARMAETKADNARDRLDALRRLFAQPPQQDVLERATSEVVSYAERAHRLMRETMTSMRTVRDDARTEATVQAFAASLLTQFEERIPEPPEHARFGRS